MKNYLVFHFSAAPSLGEILIAFLEPLPFEAFEQKEDILLGYIQDQHLELALKEIQTLAQQFNFSYEYSSVTYQNWNALWESQFNSIQIEDFCIVRADFHEPVPGITHDIIINPKMAFGTGHHETTWMVLQQMRNLDFRKKRVFDYGCGTGILAILANKLEADYILAIDNDALAVENTLENVLVNKCSPVEVRQSTLNSVNHDQFDIILANINRNVILDSINPLYILLNEQGHLIISGFLEADRSIMQKAVKEGGFRISQELSKNDWLCWELKKI